MHMEMVLILLIALVLSQLVLLLWRNFHLRSYQVDSAPSSSLINRFYLISFLLWLLCGWFRCVCRSNIFIFVLLSFGSVLRSLHSMLHDERLDNRLNPILQGKSEYLLDRNIIPRWLFRLVYKWFLLVYKVSYGLTIGGYFLIMMTFLGITNLLLISPQVRRVPF